MPLPTYQAAGAFAESAAGAISPAWPTHQANDIGLLIVEYNQGEHVHVADHQGFREVPQSPRKGGTSWDVNTCCVSVFWKRATGAAEPAPTVNLMTPEGAPDHVRGRVVTFRGCGTTGVPWNLIKGDDTYKSQATNFVLPGGTTTENDCLVVLIVGGPKDQATPFASGWTNGDLANLTERFDDNSTIGGGSGLALATGEKAVAGAFGSTSVTVPIEYYAGMMIALSSVSHTPDNSPWIANVGQRAQLAAAGSIVPAWPPHVTNDIGVLVVESGGYPVATPGGWTQFASSPQSDGASGNAATTSLHVYWKRAASGAEAAPSIAFVADHITGLIFTIRGCPTTGDPHDVEAGSVAGAQTTSVAFPAVTPTKERTRIILIGTHSNDAESRKMDPDLLANANLQGLHLKYEINSIIGSGAGILLGSGLKDGTTTTGSTTGTLEVSQRQANLTIAFKQTVSVITFTITPAFFALTFNPMNLLHHRVIKVTTANFALTFNNVALNIFRNVLTLLETVYFTVTTFPITLRKKRGIWTHKDPHSPVTWTKKDPRDDT